MKPSTTLIYDGSFNGFLTAIFVAFEEKLNVADIQKNGLGQNGLFSDSETIFTHVEKAKRVWNGIRNKSHNAITNVYFAFLSENEGVEMVLFDYIQKLMGTTQGKYLDYSDSTVASIGQLARKVGREKQRMEAFMNFQRTKDDIHFATVAPDFDVLPLISKHYRNRFADQQWLIFDTKRGYGIYYNLDHVELVSLNMKGIFNKRTQISTVQTSLTNDAQALWSGHFKNIGVKSHIKPKLHAQQMAKRSATYFEEKREAV